MCCVNHLLSAKTNHATNHALCPNNLRPCRVTWRVPPKKGASATTLSCLRRSHGFRTLLVCLAAASPATSCAAALAMECDGRQGTQAMDGMRSGGLKQMWSLRPFLSGLAPAAQPTAPVATGLAGRCGAPTCCVHSRVTGQPVTLRKQFAHTRPQTEGGQQQSFTEAQQSSPISYLRLVQDGAVSRARLAVGCGAAAP